MNHPHPHPPQGIPPIFSHFISNIPSIHSIIVFVSVKYIPISKVVVEERFLFKQVEPRDYIWFRCVVRYGYNDKIEEPKEFECQLVKILKEFIWQENFILEGGSIEQMREIVNMQHSGLYRNSSAVHVEEALENQIPSHISSSSIQSFDIAKSTNSSSRITPLPLQGVEEEMQFVQKEMEHGVFNFIGEIEVVVVVVVVWWWGNDDSF
ncbi:Potassium transporter 5 [Forsythia ovata]|uniref:Potassium transporter 5 n=2 Tax=Forsythia ovata TaxID=205694 RepID=A0ABD1NYK6_9LAMI